MSYVSVRTSTIRPGATLLFDVYVLYKDNYLKYRENSQAFEEKIFDQFKLKKIKKLFIPTEQEPAYLKYLDQALAHLQEASATVTERAELAQDTLRQESDNIEKTLESEEAYRSSESRIHKVVDFMLKEPAALAGMLSSAGLSVDDSAHGSTVSSLALALGTFSKFVGREELTDMAVAGLLHDGALKELGFDAKTDFNSLGKEDKVKYRKHPAVAVEQVSGKKFITARVLRLIQDHEEFGEGLGFPEKKRYAKLQVDSQIFNLCDAFDHFCIRSGKVAAECIDAFVAERGDHFDMELIGMLEQQIKTKAK